MTEITMETVTGFLLQEGSIGVVDHHAGITRMLHPALPPQNLILAREADRLWYNGAWHSREEFLQLCTKFSGEVQTPRPFESEDDELTSATVCTAVTVSGSAIAINRQSSRD